MPASSEQHIANLLTSAVRQLDRGNAAAAEATVRQVMADHPWHLRA